MNSRIQIIVLVLAVLGLASTPARAADYYVAPNGRDTALGTIDQPWKTLRWAVSRLQPGDELKVQAGTYPEVVLVEGLRGTAAAPIRIVAQGPVTVDPSKQLSDWRDEGNGIFSAPTGTREVVTAWDGKSRLLGPHFEWYGTAFQRPTPQTLMPHQCIQESGRFYVRLKGGRNPGATGLRVAFNYCVWLRDTHFTVWKGINACFGVNGYKLELGSSDNIISDAEIQGVACGLIETGASDGIPSCMRNSYLRLRIHDVGVTKWDHGIYTDGQGSRIEGCDFQAISGASIHAYPQAEDGLYLNNTISNPLVPLTEADFTAGLPLLPRVGYTAIVSAGRGNRVEGNVITGPFGTGIALMSEESEIARNRVMLDQGVGIDTSSRGADARIFDNILSTNGFYFTGLLNSTLEQNTFREKGLWRIGTQVFRSIDELRRAGP